VATSNDNWRRPQNYWEQADWSGIESGTEITHKHFEDLRKRLFLIRYPSAGRNNSQDSNPSASKNALQNSCSSWLQTKWANGDSETYLDRIYTDYDDNIIELTAGNYRFDNGKYNGSYPYSTDGYGLKDSQYNWGGEVVCWDGDFTTTPTEHPDYEEWDEETQQQYVKDYPVRYIKPCLFTNEKDHSFINSDSNEPPINSFTGLYDSSTHWVRTPSKDQYYDWSPRVNSFVVQQKKKIEKIPEDTDIFDAYYWTQIESNRYLPVCTDPKEQNKLAFCHGENSTYLEGEYMFIYKDKVELNKRHITYPMYQYATGGFSVYCCPTIDPDLRRCYSWPYRNSYGILDFKAHPLVSVDGYTPYTEDKLCDSYQTQIEYTIDIGPWLSSVDSDYITNFLRYENIYNTFYQTYPYPDGWKPNKYSSQDPYEYVNGAGRALYFGCNGSGTELFLKKTGRFNWFLDTTHPPMTASVKIEKIKDSIWAPYNYDERWYPEPHSCWRRVWKEGFGKKGGYYWDDNWGDPPGYESDDCRMWVNQADYNYIKDEIKTKYYRVVDLESIISEIESKYAEEADPSNYDLDNISTPLTNLEQLNKSYDPVQTLYKGYVECKKYQLKFSMLNDMRNVLRQCIYGGLSNDIEKFQRRTGWSCNSTTYKYMSGYWRTGWEEPYYMNRHSVNFPTSSFYTVGKERGYGIFGVFHVGYEAAIKILAIDDTPIDSTIHLRITTIPISNLAHRMATIQSYIDSEPCTNCCEMEWDLGEIGCSCGKITYTYVQTQIPDEDKFYPIKNLCELPFDIMLPVQIHLISFAQTNHLFFETDWDTVPESVWQRDTLNTTFRDCFDCDSNPSDYNTDTDAPESGDDNKDDPTEPLWHDGPIIITMGGN